MKQTARFDLVLVGYRLEDTREAIRFCDRAFDAALVRRRLVVLNRAELQRPLACEMARWECLIGSNRFAEFSGWQEGMDRLDADLEPTHGVIFVNDTVSTHRHFTSARRAAFVDALRAAPTASITGFVDRVGGSLSVGGLPLSSWTSTYCFGLTAQALDRLERRLYDEALVASCVPGGLHEESFFANLSPDLDAHLRHWLFEGAWYNGERLSAANTQRMQRKALGIIAEKLLSARCLALQIEVIDPFVRFPVLRQLDRLQRRIALAWTDSRNAR